ncbi:MAG: hypothetical protein ACLP50_09330 [Solirubrobacteraceae bacterium]
MSSGTLWTFAVAAIAEIHRSLPWLATACADRSREPAPFPGDVRSHGQGIKRRFDRTEPLGA